MLCLGEAMTLQRPVVIVVLATLCVLAGVSFVAVEVDIFQQTSQIEGISANAGWGRFGGYAIGPKTTSATVPKVILCLVLSSGFLPQTPKEAPPKAQITALLEQFRSANWEDRASAFYRLLDLGRSGRVAGETVFIRTIVTNLFNSYPQQAEEIKVALIDLLAKENSVVEAQNEDYRRTGRTLTEGQVNYWGDLIAAVSSLQDKRSLQALLGAIDTGNMATRALAGFGRDALGPVIAKLDDSSEITRSSAIRTISQMLAPRNMEKVSDPTSKAQIKRALIRGVGDESPFVRISAIEGLAKLHDPDVTPLLERLAREDPYDASTYGGEKGTYPVREAAKKALGLQK